MREMNVECPWCAEEVVLTADSICPLCMHEVLPEHMEVAGEGAGANEERSAAAERPLFAQMTVRQLVADRFQCLSCGGSECFVEETPLVATGQAAQSGPSTKMYLLASCSECARVEMYDPAVLRAGTGSGQ